jgi:transcriptional regulator GlxA family with amidase domain
VCRETEILDVAPVDLIHGMSKHFTEPMPEEIVPAHLKDQALDLAFHWVSEAGPDTPSRLTGGIRLLPTDSFATCPALDIVLVGAHNAQYTPNEAEIAFIRKAYEDCAAFISICGGVQVPLQAGLLDGKKATGPRPMLPVLRQQAPTTEWFEKRWVRDGKLWTSGALLNGLDLMHEFTHENWGRRESKEESLLGFISKICAVPNRDVDYKDVSWTI